MKVIFLDIDGVLNCCKDGTKIGIDGLVEWDAFSKPLYHTSEFPVLDCGAITNLNTITRATGAKIVISSSWRISPWGQDQDEYFYALVSYLKNCGICGEIIGKTPKLYGEVGCVKSSERGDEIALWLSNKKDLIESFVVLDDDNDMTAVKDHFVLIEKGWVEGLKQSEAERAIQILNQ